MFFCVSGVCVVCCSIPIECNHLTDNGQATAKCPLVSSPTVVQSVQCVSQSPSGLFQFCLFCWWSRLRTAIARTGKLERHKQPAGERADRSSQAEDVARPITPQSFDSDLSGLLANRFPVPSSAICTRSFSHACSER